MQFDLLRFYRTASKPYRTEFPVDLSKEDFPGYEVPNPVSAVFSADIERDELVLELSVKAVVTAECARCLEPLEREFCFERSFVLKERDLMSEEQDLPIDQKGVMDLNELVFQELVMEVPPVLLCSPDCLGLCPVCGKKIGAGCTCKAQEEPVPMDPRLSILKQLLN